MQSEQHTYLFLIISRSVDQKLTLSPQDSKRKIQTTLKKFDRLMRIGFLIALYSDVFQRQLVLGPDLQ